MASIKIFLKTNSHHKNIKSILNTKGKAIVAEILKKRNRRIIIHLIS